MFFINDKDKDYAKVIKAPGAVLTVKSSKNLEVLCTSENIGVIIAVASQTTTARDVLDFYSPLAKSNVDVDIGGTCFEISLAQNWCSGVEFSAEFATELSAKLDAEIGAKIGVEIDREIG